MFASELILGFRYLLRDSAACCRFPTQWEVLKHSLKRRKWEHNSLEAFMSCRRRRKVTNFHSISRIKRCGSEGFRAGTRRVWSGAVAAFHPQGTLICSVIKSCGEAFTIRIPCIKTQSRPQVWALLFELIKSPRGLGELDRWLALACFVASATAPPPPQHLFFHAFSCQRDVSPR